MKRERQRRVIGNPHSRGEDGRYEFPQFTFQLGSHRCVRFAPGRWLYRKSSFFPQHGDDSIGKQRWAGSASQNQVIPDARNSELRPEGPRRRMAPATSAATPSRAGARRPASEAHESGAFVRLYKRLQWGTAEPVIRAAPWLATTSIWILTIGARAARRRSSLPCVARLPRRRASSCRP